MEKLPKEPTPEDVDAEIEQKLKELYENYSELVEIGSELDDKWYWVEQEANVGKDRQAAKKHLEEFIEKLEEIKKREAGK